MHSEGTSEEWISVCERERDKSGISVFVMFCRNMHFKVLTSYHTKQGHTTGETLLNFVWKKTDIQTIQVVFVPL